MPCPLPTEGADSVSECRSPGERTPKVERIESHPNSGYCWALPGSGLLPTMLIDANLCGPIPWVRGEQWLLPCFLIMKRSKTGFRPSTKDFQCAVKQGNWS